MCCVYVTPRLLAHFDNAGKWRVWRKIAMLLNEDCGNVACMYHRECLHGYIAATLYWCYTARKLCSLIVALRLRCSNFAKWRVILILQCRLWEPCVYVTLKRVGWFLFLVTLQQRNVATVTATFVNFLTEIRRNDRRRSKRSQPIGKIDRRNGSSNADGRRNSSWKACKCCKRTVNRTNPNRSKTIRSFCIGKLRRNSRIASKIWRNSLLTSQ